MTPARLAEITAACVGHAFVPRALVQELAAEIERLAQDRRATPRYLIAADDKKTPGKVVCTFVTFDVETINIDAYDAKRADFIVLQPDMPQAALLRRLLAET
jgi:hypothetical protein